MHKKLTKALAVGTLSTAFVFGGASAAQAADFYVPGTSISVTATKTAARTYVVTVKSGTFGAGRTVTIKIPKALFARFARFGDVTAGDAATWTTTSNADGGVDPFTVEMPGDLSGTFTLLAEDDDSTAVSSTFAVSEAGVTTAAPDPAAGPDGAAIGLWVGAAAVVLAGGALAVGGTRSRRQHISI